MRLVFWGSISPNPVPEGNPSSPPISGNANGTHRIQTSLHNIKIAHLNIRSLKNREQYILAKETVFANNLDIFTVSEAWLNSTVSDIELVFPSFNILSLDREIKTGGSVCIFVKQEFKVERLQDLSFIAESDLHMLWVKSQSLNHF